MTDPTREAVAREPMVLFECGECGACVEVNAQLHGDPFVIGRDALAKAHAASCSQREAAQRPQPDASDLEREIVFLAESIASAGLNATGVASHIRAFADIVEAIDTIRSFPASEDEK